MKILYLSVPGGGLDSNVRLLGPALVQAGHRVSILYIHHPGEKTLQSADEFRGCQLYHVQMGDWHYYARRVTLGLTSMPRLVRVWEHMQALGRFVQALQAHEGLDLIEIPEVFISAAGLGRLPYVVRLHSSAWMCRRLFGDPLSLSDSVERFLEAGTLSQACGISSPSAFVAAYIRSGCRVQQPIHVIPYPVDTNQFCPGPKPLRPVVLAVGRVEKRKGADTLLRALPRVAARFPDCDFVFAGRVSADMIEMVRDAPQQAKFLGWLPREELVRWYQRATIVTAPSVWDNSPNTVYEAMSCSTPVIASRVGGIPELVDDGLTGLLTPPEDAEALAEAILTLLLDSARRDAMGRAGREKAMRQYAVSTVLHKTLSIYEQTLAGGAVADNR